MMIEGVSGTQSTSSKVDTQVQTESAYSAPAKVDLRPIDAPKDTVRRSDDEDKNSPLGEQKEPSASSVDSAMSSANNKMTKTRCEYSYDEATKRVSIKVFDKDNDKLIREVPSEKALEMLQKVMELAGMMVDEKR